MKRYLAVFLVVLPLCAQLKTGGSKHLLGTNAPLTAPSGLPTRAIAQEFIRTTVAAELSLSPADLAGVYVAKEYQTSHNGVTHLIYKQQFNGVDVFNAEWVVNVAPDGSILNSGGTLFAAPASGVGLPPANSAMASARAAVRHINPKVGQNYFPLITGTTSRKNGIKLAGGQLPLDVEGELIWYGDQSGVKPAWLFYITDTDGIQRYATVVDDATASVRAQQPLTFFQSPPPGPKGQVFERESPQPNPTPGVRLTAAPPLVDRTLQPFTGDPKASPVGWVTSNQTVGNNAIVGENLLGTAFLTTPAITTAPDGNFSFPLQLGASAPSPLTFTDAANTNLFYWMNRAHDLHYAAGFDEAAGNFQASNLGRPGTDGDPIYAYSHYGAQSLSFAQLENAFWTARSIEDGAQSMVAMFLSQSNNNDFFTDGSYDSVVMVHEYTHGVSERLVRQGYSTFQGASMGEAWSDFYGIEYTLPTGAPPDGVYAAAEYFDQSWGTGDIRSRPYSTNLDVNPITYATLGHVAYGFPEVHADGEIWFEAMWEARANLIKQFGEAEGRRRIRMLVMDGMKLSVPAPSMVDMRDAILLADRVDFSGASQAQLWAAFAKRGLGALAYSSGGNTVHVVSSFDLPSATGQLRFYDDPMVIGETTRIILQDSSLNRPTVRIQVTSSSGDLENLDLRQQGSIYTSSLPTSATPGPQLNGVLSLATGDSISAYYTHFGAPGNQQTSTTAAAVLPYTASFLQPGPYAFATERRLNMNGATYKRVDMPFLFPFFSNQYGAVLVHTNGLLSFDLPIGTSCTDVSTFSHFNGITPLWANLTTLGAAQPREDVYMSQAGPDQVTFHWLAETRTPFPPPGQPVDFAATLYKDGRIEFTYNQKSNANTSFDATYYGCGLGPILGISNGHDTFTQAFVTDNTAGGGSTVHFDPPFGGSTLPVGILESPKAGDQAQDILTVSGIAYDRQSLITRIDIYIDGVVRSRTTPTVSRPDFCSGANATINGCPRVGFQANLNLGALNIAAGNHTLSLRVTNSRGGFTDVAPVSFSTIAGQAQKPRGKIEAPANGDTVSDNFAVRGWALDDTLRIVSVDLLIDGLTNTGLGVTYGRARTDICNALTTKPPNCPNVGFSATIPTRDAFPALVDGQHTMMLRVRDETGRSTVLTDSAVTFTVKNGPDANIVAALTSPKNNDKLSGTVTVTGYAYAPGFRVTSVFIVLDNAFLIGSAKLNQPSPDVCAGLTGVPSCPNAGFTFTLDTTHLLNGPHLLGVEVIDENGDFVFIPKTTAGGINVFVQN